MATEEATITGKENNANKTTGETEFMSQQQQETMAVTIISVSFYFIYRVKMGLLESPKVEKGGKTEAVGTRGVEAGRESCLLYTSPSPRDMYKSRMPSSA